MILKNLLRLSITSHVSLDLSWGKKESPAYYCYCAISLQVLTYNIQHLIKLTHLHDCLFKSKHLRSGHSVLFIFGHLASSTEQNMVETC